MPQPVIIQRLEEAADACSSLEEETKAAKEPLEDLVGRVEALGEALETEGDKTHQAIEEARTMLAELRATLEAAGRESRAQLQEVGERAEELREDCGQALQRVEDRLAEIGSRRDELVGALDAGVQLTSTECQEIGAQVEALQGEVAQGLQMAFQGIGAFRTALEETRTNFAEMKSRWDEALVTLQSSAQAQTTASVQKVTTLLHTVARAFVDAGNMMINEHNAAMERLWQGLAVEATEQVGSGLDDETVALEGLESLWSEHSQTLQASSPAFVGLMQSVSSMLDELKSDVGAATARVPRVD